METKFLPPTRLRSLKSGDIFQKIAVNKGLR